MAPQSIGQHMNDKAKPGIQAHQAKKSLSLGDIKEIGVKLINDSIDARQNTDHHKYHVGASLLAIYPTSQKIKQHHSSFANKIPRALQLHKTHKDQFRSKDPNVRRIGGGHPTVHGEFQGLYKAQPAEHLFLGCNTPLCANCMKSAIMRGVDAIFIDGASLPEHAYGRDGKKNPWSEDFNKLWYELCLELAKKVKIPIYAVYDREDPEGKKSKINPEQAEIITLVEGLPPEQRPKAQYPVQMFSRSQFEKILEKNPEKFLSQKKGLRRSVARATNENGEEIFLYAKASYPPGFSGIEAARMTKKFKNAHYEFTLDPLINIAMTASKCGLKLQDGRIATNYIPDSGRQLDMAYVGIDHILFTEDHLPLPVHEDGRQSEHESAMKDLTDLGIIHYSKVSAAQAMLRLVLNPTHKAPAHDKPTPGV